MGNSSKDAAPIQSHYDWLSTDPSIAIAYAIASLEDVTPGNLFTELDTKLYEYVDPDALDSLVTRDEVTHVSLTIDEYKVQIDGNMLRVYYE